MGENKEEKEGILDIKLILNQNRKINIEMQNTYQDDWTERSLFYNCRMFTDGFQKGHPYGEIPPCIHVGILNFNQMISPNYYHKVSLMDEKERYLYLREEMAESDRVSQIESAQRLGRKEGKKEGELVKLIMLIQKKMGRGDTKEKIMDDLFNGRRKFN